ncbi:hypothetical protein PN36_02240 [Candidatus Thiomargarita nelsonii]|uniref:Uncharacterized protein n=1 Tax=Candidatus Thiomargarita nelsonii TaxID=1003181 RepID=A0A0A6P7L6_9GAMM|nr:hypothetical protein PN36_02240 [Candidatus Thiomargarita nelsonii]
MLKEITFSLEEDLIQKAIAAAYYKHTTLETEFRQWLNNYIYKNQRADDYTKLMNELSHVQAGRIFSRDELNER